MENKKQVLVIFIAIGIGILAAILVGDHIQNTLRRETQNLATQHITPLKENVAAVAQSVQVIDRQVQTLAAQQSQTAAAVQELQTKVESRTVKQDPSESLALKMPAGKRAYTIMLDSLNAVGGLINPGDYVDVMADLQIPEDLDDKEAEKKTVTTVLFQRIQVMAVGPFLTATGAYAEQQEAKFLKVTFALDPQEAGIMAFAEKNGTFKLALRSPNEQDQFMLPTSNWITVAEYLEEHGTELPVPNRSAKDGETSEEFDFEPVEEAKPVIQIFRGGKEL